jgi:hypothetical protein
MSQPESLEHGEIEPCEVITQSTDITATTDITASTDVSEIDLSGYNYDLVPTYKMIEDLDDQDTLFRIQFLQAFGITNDEYHPEIISAVINDLYERYILNPRIRELIEAHPLYNSNVGSGSGGPSDEDDNGSEGGGRRLSSASASASNNSEMIFCMMFSFQLFDLFHKCLRHAKQREEIPAETRNEIIECWRTMF